MRCLLTELDDSRAAAGGAMSPEQEAKKIMQTIRRDVRMLNRKWAELKQKSNEWQHKLDQCLPVICRLFIGCVAVLKCVCHTIDILVLKYARKELQCRFLTVLTDYGRVPRHL